jgi:hypothetical protein
MKTGLYVIVENGVIPQEVFTRASRGIEVGTKTKILLKNNTFSLSNFYCFQSVSSLVLGP